MSKSKKPKVPAEVVGSPAPAKTPCGATKLENLIALLRQDAGVSLVEMQAATGWQAHSVRGALSGTIAKRKGLPVTSRLVDGQRRYFINGGA